MTKDDIESYLKEKNIKYYIDATNMTDEHLRNRYRKNVLPILKEEYKNVHLKFLKFHEEAQGYYDFVNKLVYQYMDDMFVDNILDINKFNKLDDFIKDKLLREVIRIYYPDDLYLIDDNHINEILKMINSNKPNIDLVLPNITITKKYDKLLFNNIKLFNNSYKYELVDKVDTPLGVIKLIDKDDNDTSNNIIRLNSKDIKLPLIVRTRESGDKIHVKNMNGSKKVNDIFIDSKIENDKRDIYPVIIDSNGTVIFIQGLKKSNFDIAINGDYDIIVKYEKGEK
jgi:tRNA(Ile)-lysidine synthase